MSSIIYRSGQVMNKQPGQFRQYAKLDHSPIHGDTPVVIRQNWTMSYTEGD